MKITTNNTTNNEYSGKLGEAFFNIERVFKSVQEYEMEGPWIYDGNPIAVVGFDADIHEIPAEKGGGRCTTVTVMTGMPLIELITRETSVKKVTVCTVTGNSVLGNELTSRYYVQRINDRPCRKFLSELREEELEVLACMFGLAGTAPGLRKLEETEEDS